MSHRRLLLIALLGATACAGKDPDCADDTAGRGCEPVTEPTEPGPDDTAEASPDSSSTSPCTIDTEPPTLDTGDTDVTTTDTGTVACLDDSALTDTGTTYAVYDLATAHGIWTGVQDNDHVGNVVAPAGDVNADGYDDILIGMQLAKRAGVNVGGAFLVFGPGDGINTVDDADVSFGTEGGEGYVGALLMHADMNDDGVDDVLVGDWNEDLVTAGRVGIWFGPLGAGDYTLDDADAWLVHSTLGQYVGLGFDGGASAGDTNGDGYTDLLIHKAGPNALHGAFLVNGPVLPGDSIDLATAAVEFRGDLTADFYGSDRAGVGDVDGDGLDDFLLGHFGDNGAFVDTGAAYMFRGGWVTGLLGPTDADVTYTGAFPHAQVGAKVMGGDFDGDGNQELAIAAWEDDYFLYYSQGGSVYIVDDPQDGVFDLQCAATARIRGENRLANFASAMDNPGDLDGDGTDDVVATDPVDGGVAPLTVGATYVLLGPFSGTMTAQDAWYKIPGEMYPDTAGLAVSGAGDVDADGTPDLLLSSVNASRTAPFGGAVYIVSGADL